MVVQACNLSKPMKLPVLYQKRQTYTITVGSLTQSMSLLGRRWSEFKVAEIDQFVRKYRLIIADWWPWYTLVSQDINADVYQLHPSLRSTQDMICTHILLGTVSSQPITRHDLFPPCKQTQCHGKYHVVYLILSRFTCRSIGSIMTICPLLLVC